jgi:hypothetical protein
VPRAVPACAIVLVVSFASCRRAVETGSPAADPVARPLAVYAAQRVIVAPTAHVRAADSLGWANQPADARSVARRLDTSIVAVLDARGLASRWVLPAELSRSYERNRTYATDPYALVVEQLRASSFKAGDQFGEPLSSQLRTMIALHGDARFVLLPVDLRFDKVGSAARGVLRVALLDPRFAEAKWVGDVRGDAATAPSVALASVATRLADLFIAP